MVLHICNLGIWEMETGESLKAQGWVHTEFQSSQRYTVRSAQKTKARSQLSGRSAALQAQDSKFSPQRPH